MIKTLLLIFEPSTTWERIFRARRSVGFVLALNLLPLLLASCIAEGYSLYYAGSWRELGPRKFYSRGETAIFETAQFLLYLTVVFLGAGLIKSISETFHSRHNYAQAVRLVAYGLGPLFLFHFLDAISDISPWVPWAIGITLSIGVLYRGVPMMLEPDPAHAFGLYLFGSLLLLLATGVARFITAWYLQGKFIGLESSVSRLAERLPFL